MNLDNLTTFLGWCSVINLLILSLTSLLLIAGKNTFARIHASLLGMQEMDVKIQYFQYLGHYKIMIIVLNLVPYLALKMML